MSVNGCLSLCVRPVTDSTDATVNLENASKYLIINCQVTFQDGCQVSNLAYIVVVFELLSFRSSIQGLWMYFRSLKFIIQFMKKIYNTRSSSSGEHESFYSNIFSLYVCSENFE